MKKIFKLLSILLLGALFSCSNDMLDLSPSNGVPSDQAVNNYNDAVVALNGMYDALQGSSTYPNYYAARMIYYGDVKADDMQATSATGRTGPTYMMNFTINDAPGIWQVPYRVIRRTNFLLQQLEEGKAADGKPADINDIKGQALAIRALAHFDLVRIYGEPYAKSQGKALGIPLILEPVPYNYVAGRNTVEEVYNQVIADLTAAISLLKPGKSTGYFNQWAAKALLARVYLYKNDNENAYKTALDVINNSGYTLWKSSDYATVWSTQGSSEVLFEIVNFDTNDWGDRESIGYLYSELGYNDGVMTKNFVDLVQTQYANDVRQSVMIRSSLSDADAAKKPWGLNKVYTNKYPGRNGDIRTNNIPTLRLSETYLIAAEAAAKLGDSSNAAKYLNAIVQRGNPSAVAIAPAAATVDRILQENRIEFVGEGHRFFDLMRNNKQVVRYKTEADRGWHLLLSTESRDFNISYFRTLLPIPVDEVNANPIIKKQQNPEYN